MSTPVDNNKDMEGSGRITLMSNSSEVRKTTRKSVDTISILVVDDDTTCLSIVAAILKKFKYEVVTVKHPKDALCTLRIKGGAFDLVVSDVHMPDMNGFELQQAIAQEFDLPVVLMSADDKEGVALKGLENGAAFFILKPVSPDDVRDLWQFAAMRKKSQVVIEETENSPAAEEKSSTAKNNSNHDKQVTTVVSASSVNGESTSKKETKRKSPRKEGSVDKKGEASQSPSRKKPKVVWTNSLHNRFLEAIRSIGLDRAVPKKILEVMNVPGLTRENVASHLQKYRIFLRRVSDASYKIQYSPDRGSSKNTTSSITSSSRTNTSTLNLNKFSKLPYQNPRQFPGRSTLHVPPLPNPQAGPSSSLSGFGQPRLLSNKGSGLVLKPNITNPNDRPFARLAHNNDYFQNRASIQGHLFSNAPLPTSFATSTPFNNNVFPSMNNFNTQHISSNYVGYSISNLKHLTAPSGPGGLNSCGGTMVNLPGDGFSMSSDTNLHTGLVPCGEDNNAIDVDLLAQNLGFSNNIFRVDGNINIGEQPLSDYGMVMPSYNQPSLGCGLENGGEIHHGPELSPMFDLSEFDNFMSQEPPDFVTSLADHQVVNIQNQAQVNAVAGETITSSNVFGGTIQWDQTIVQTNFGQANNQLYSQGLVNSQDFGNSSQLCKTTLLPTNDQLQQQGLTNTLFNASSSHFNKNVTSSPERVDDDFLESLLAPYDEDQTLEGI